MSRMRYLWFAVSMIPALAIGPAAAAQTHQDNVVIILDGSGSMSEKMPSMPLTKMQAAQDALKQVMQQIPDSTHVGLLVFSSSHAREPWVQALGPRDVEAMSQAIDSVEAGGGTPLGAFIKLGADRLLQEREEQFGYGSYRLLVVTDGQATDEPVMRRYAPEVLARGITMDVIGVDMEQNHSLAAIAHSYRKADDPEGLTQALAEVFAEISADDAAQGQEVDFALLEGIPVEMASAMIETISKPINLPLGETRSETSSPTPISHQPRMPGNPPALPSQPVRTTTEPGGGPGIGWILIVAAVIVIAVARSRRSGRRR